MTPEMSTFLSLEPVTLFPCMAEGIYRWGEHPGLSSIWDVKR